ncbi:transmembrane gamma-carboxyglutamic acid protein 4 [Neosynchiropus ocellatus]
MLLNVFLLLLLLLSWGDLACVKTVIQNNEAPLSEDVFVEEGEANAFLGRHLLLNRFDFEIFVPGNLERECMEEDCNYEEAREVFENIPETDAFWKKYIADKERRSARVDVTSLLVGLIIAGIAVVILCLLLWYFCQGKCKDGLNRPGSAQARAPPRRGSNASLIMYRLEQVSLQPGRPAHLPALEEIEPPGLPTYEQAIAKSGQHDAPPPPYPGSRPGTIRR